MTMRSVVVLEANATPIGSTRLSRLQASGALAVRRTADCEVHLVGTAAGPVGDDVIEIHVHVGEGATLAVNGVAATIALAGAVPGISRVSLDVTVAEGARLELTMPPLIVTRDADVGSATDVVLDPGAHLVLTEQVVFGRAAEPGGRWHGCLLVDIGPHPALRQTQTSDVLAHAIPSGEGKIRGALVTRFVHMPGHALPPAGSVGGAYVVPLQTGGWQVTSVGPELASTLRDLRRCDPHEALSIGSGAAQTADGLIPCRQPGGHGTAERSLR
jgi:urease accessory protein